MFKKIAVAFDESAEADRFRLRDLGNRRMCRGLEAGLIVDEATRSIGAESPRFPGVRPLFPGAFPFSCRKIAISLGEQPWHLGL
jgi:hypothetical protein